MKHIADHLNQMDIDWFKDHHPSEDQKALYRAKIEYAFSLPETAKAYALEWIREQ